MKRIQAVTISILIATISSGAQAHTGFSANGFAHGFMHPISGLDHILAMIAVGLWAVQLASSGSKRAVWLVPLSFVSMMVIGGILGISGIELPFVEKGILVSVLVLGAFVLAGVRLPITASAAIVGLFALFHGHAHGAEMPATSSGLTYALGFAFATALLHASGIALGLIAQRRLSSLALRVAGAAVTLGGVYLMLT
jgi:urease accessory protein